MGTAVLETLTFVVKTAAWGNLACMFLKPQLLPMLPNSFDCSSRDKFPTHLGLNKLKEILAKTFQLSCIPQHPHF
jgi:hypothetical protein